MGSSQKKIPFHRHREAEEARKKREDDEAARVYAEFVESFKGDNAPGSKTFVRGGVIDPNDRLKANSEGGKSKDGVSVPKKGSRYVPSFLPPPSHGRELEKKDDEKPREKEKGKTRHIDKFLEELKFEQELREKRNQEREGRHTDTTAPVSHFDELPDDFDPSGKFPGSFDDGDPQTTNLYVGNLSPKVDENFLLRTFGRFGPIASVKIMWPRTEEERRRQRNCGFVAFMNRADGQAAKDEMQGVVVYEYELKIGWGKSVALPAQALPAPPPGHMAIRNKEGNTVIISGPDGAPVTSQSSELVLTPNIPDIVVVTPEDDHLRHVIDTMALYVLDGGCAFEQAVMERGRGNALFDFLFDLRLKEHTYYVWRLYSFAQGDTLQRWRTEPFIMITGSGRWVPPSLPANRSPEHDKESASTFAAGRSRRVDLERALTDPQRDEFEDMLRALTLERSQIREAMGFALDNADAAGEVVEVLTESLTLKETPVPTKVARLMLVSDILHNSSAPIKNASAYRTKFEANLPDIMESFNDLYRSITGRITAEALKERVLKVLQVWADWFLFSDAYLNGLRATFLRSGNSGVFPFHSLCGDAPEIENQGNQEEGYEGSKSNQDAALAVGKGAATKELMGLPLPELERRCRHNGLSLCGGREMMVARLLNLEEAERERGLEQDDHTKYGQNQFYKNIRDESIRNVNAGSRETNSDREMSPTILPFAREVTTRHDRGSGSTESAVALDHKAKSDPVLASKWNREDGGSDEDKSSPDLGLGYSSESENAGDFLKSGAEVDTDKAVHIHPDNSLNEEKRQKLRRLEVAVVEYRESLEERGLRSAEEIDRKVAVYRRQLEFEFGLSDTTDDQGSKKSSSERRSSERREKSDDVYDSSRKRRRSRSISPERKDRTRERHREKDRSFGSEIGREGPREKNGGKERDDHHNRDKTREREKDRRRNDK
ncbi:protein RRC1-like [Zingiber officinale]|nr:protein RRC1-like [Zingiber officinale]